MPARPCGDLSDEVLVVVGLQKRIQKTPDLAAPAISAIPRHGGAIFIGTHENRRPQLYFFTQVGYYPVTTVTIFRYVAKREATRRNGTDEYSVEISGVSDLSFLFAMRFGAEV